MNAIAKTIRPPAPGCRCGARTEGQCVCAMLGRMRREEKKYYNLIQLERDRLWHIKPKGESRVFKRLRTKLHRYVLVSLMGKQK